MARKKEILPRDWEQINILPLVRFSYSRKKFILTPTQMIEFIKTIADSRMVRQSFWKDSKSGLLWSFVSTEPFSRRGFLSLSHLVGSLVLHANLFFNLLAIFSEWFAFQESKNTRFCLRKPGWFLCLIEKYRVWNLYKNFLSFYSFLKKITHTLLVSWVFPVNEFMVVELHRNLWFSLTLWSFN